MDVERNYANATTCTAISDWFKNLAPVYQPTRRSMSVHWVTCGTCYSKTEGTELGGIELYRSSHFFQVGGH